MDSIISSDIRFVYDSFDFMRSSDINFKRNLVKQNLQSYKIKLNNYLSTIGVNDDFSKRDGTTKAEIFLWSRKLARTRHFFLFCSRLYLIFIVVYVRNTNICKKEKNKIIQILILRLLKIIYGRLSLNNWNIN